MPKTIDTTAIEGNRNSSDSKAPSVPILDEESELLRQRIKEVVGDEPRRAFARRAQLSDTALRDYIEGRRRPKREALEKIARAGMVVGAWLTEGRLPKTRAESRTASSQSQSQTEGQADDDSEMLQAVIRVAEHALRGADVSIEVAQRIEEAATAMAAKAQRWPELAARLEAARAAAALFRTTQQATSRD